MSRLFDAYIGIDYSGADKPNAPIKGLAVAAAYGEEEGLPLSAHVLGEVKERTAQSGTPIPVTPSNAHSPFSTSSVSNPSAKSGLWSRRRIYEWLRHELLHSEKRMLIGLDFGLSYPLSQLERLQLPDWDTFLRWSYITWKTDVLTMKQSKEQAEYINSTDKRLVEREFIPSTKSVTDLDRISGMQGAVSYSTHTGLPWIYWLRRWQKRGMKVHFWPYDGLHIPDDYHVITEAYPSLYRRRMMEEQWSEGLSEHERDAMYIARWMQSRDLEQTLAPYLELPTLSEQEKQLTLREGWVLGCL
ncbi:hypothetical protein [Paenibacillus kandeliae]|uniref:hypothetical protein n=1 Tax=Paenibacillus kandeliae TaxID=3231269 RepID=UPI00345749F0